MAKDKNLEAEMAAAVEKEEAEKAEIEIEENAAEKEEEETKDINKDIITFVCKDKPNLAIFNNKKFIQFASGVYMTNSKKDIEFLGKYPGVEEKK